MAYWLARSSTEPPVMLGAELDGLEEQKALVTRRVHSGRAVVQMYVVVSPCSDSVTLLKSNPAD